MAFTTVQIVEVAATAPVEAINAQVKQEEVEIVNENSNDPFFDPNFRYKNLNCVIA